MKRRIIRRHRAKAEESNVTYQRAIERRSRVGCSDADFVHPFCVKLSTVNVFFVLFCLASPHLPVCRIIESSALLSPTVQQYYHQRQEETIIEVRQNGRGIKARH